jgi:hypothetical protein
MTLPRRSPPCATHQSQATATGDGMTLSSSFPAMTGATRDPPSPRYLRGGTLQGRAGPLQTLLARMVMSEPDGH